MRGGGRDTNVAGTSHATGRGCSSCQVRDIGDGDPISTGKSSPIVEVNDEATITHEGWVIRVERDIVVDVSVGCCQSYLL